MQAALTWAGCWVLGAALLLSSFSPAAPRPAASYTCPGPPPAPAWLEMSRVCMGERYFGAGILLID